VDEFSVITRLLSSNMSATVGCVTSAAITAIPKDASVETLKILSEALVFMGLFPYRIASAARAPGREVERSRFHDFHKWLSQDLAKKASVVSSLIRQLCRKNFRYRLTNRSSHPILADIKQSDFPKGGEPRDWRLILVRIS